MRFLPINCAKYVTDLAKKHGTLWSNVHHFKSMHNSVIEPGLITSVYFQCFDPECVKGYLNLIRS